MELFLLLGSSFFLGAVHALEPGHGKMLVMAYLGLSENKIRDSFLLAAAATLTHTLSILGLGAVVYFFAAKLPHSVEHSFEVIAAFLILAIGVAMLLSYKKSCSCKHHNDTRPEIKKMGLLYIFGLGFSGGIVPCPASLAVLSTALASGEMWKGVLLIGVFSLGLGTLLFTTGIVFTRASVYFKNHFENKGFERKARMLSSYIIFFLGAGLLTKALLE